MNKIYDNGGLLLGDVQYVIMEVQRELEENIDMFDINMENLLKDLKELRDIAFSFLVHIIYHFLLSIYLY